MQQVFQYPLTYPTWWLDSYYFFTWLLGLSLLAVGWGVFFRFGKFSYGIDLGCLWQSKVLLLLTTVSFAIPQAYNTRFIAEHGQAGDVITLDENSLSYNYRRGVDKNFALSDIVRIYKEPVSFNPPSKYFVVTETGQTKDSVFVTKNLPGFEKMLDELSVLTNVPFER